MKCIYIYLNLYDNRTELKPITATGIAILSSVGGLLFICIAVVTFLEIKKKISNKSVDVSGNDVGSSAVATEQQLNQPLM